MPRTLELGLRRSRSLVNEVHYKNKLQGLNKLHEEQSSLLLCHLAYGRAGCEVNMSLVSHGMRQ